MGVFGSCPGRESLSWPGVQELDFNKKQAQLLDGFPILCSPGSFLKTERREHLFVQLFVILMINVQHIDTEKLVVL